MHTFDDNDIKIFGAPKIENEADVLMRIVEIMKKQRANGNMDRAKELGERIARQIYSPENINSSVAESIAQYKSDEAIYEQIKMLVTFAAEAQIHLLLEKYSVSTMAVNSLYDELIKLDDDLYDNITNAFTFYYLELRKGGDVAELLGKRFAKLCGDKENDALVSLGGEIFISISEIIKEEIESTDFVND
ncbi:MAG: hypothetical protein J6L89_00385 [Clostridia bacterium]|nr:hypothetical protein [Clostridia bacterium]